MNKLEKKHLLADLRALLKLFTPPKTWIKGWFASTEWRKGEIESDSEGAVFASDPAAVCWCLSGGIDKLIPEHRNIAVRRALQNAVPATHQARGFVAYNDDPKTRKQDILALIRRAISNTQKVKAVEIPAVAAP